MPEMTRVAIFTTCSNHELAAARVLLNAAQSRHPEAGLFLCLVDRKLDAPDLYEPAWTVIQADQLAIRHFTEFAFRYDCEELQAAVKPFVFQRILEEFDYDVVIYLNRDRQVFRPLSSVLQRFSAGASCVLAPLRTGTLDLGFLALRREAGSARLLASWARRVRFQCIDTQRQDGSIDRAFFDAVPDAALDGEIVEDADCGYPAGNDGHADKPHAAGYGVVPAGLYVFGRFASGTVIHPLVRQMFRTWHTFWPDCPFVSYETFLHEPWPGASRQASSSVVTNFQKFLYDRLPHLHSRLDLTDAADVREMVDWYVASSARELQLDLQLIEPVAARMGRNRAHATASAAAAPSDADVTVVGYLRTASGVGEVGRQTLLTLAVGGLAAEGVDVALGVLSLRDDDSVARHIVERGSAAVQVFNVNADQLPAVLDHTRTMLPSGALRINVPFWELERFPDAWIPGLAAMDEIWAPSRFIQAALAARLECPVLHMPVAIEIEAVNPLPRGRFGLPQGRFLFFFAFDFLSYVERKNPYAAIAAFRSAFPSHGEAGLVLKCMNGTVTPDQFAAFREVVGGDPDIFIVDQTLSRADTLGLIAATDAVLSLHRSEGLGLLIAEAMLLGKPVIATDYSASREFVTDATGYPVGCRLVELREGDYPFWDGQVWADPDIAHAAWHMRRLAADPDAAAAKRTNARQHLRRHHGRAAVGKFQAQRLRLLLNR